MKHLLLVAALSLACASSAPPPVATADAAPRRRRRRRRPAPAPAAPVDPNLPSTPRTDAPARAAAEFGSPVVAPVEGPAPLLPRLLPDGRVVCEGDAPAQVASTQSPYEPTSEMIALSARSQEAAVLACAPQVGADGLLTVRVRISGSGLPQELAFPEGTRRRTARCLGRALCGLRLSAFRASFTTIPYTFAVPRPAAE
ncbi:MAG: hypothetical protein R3A48_02050 [Polyangiales bacterium]